MNHRRLASMTGAGACLVTALVVAVPFVLIEGQPRLVGDYYAAGPVGLTAVAFFALIGIVAFASADRGNIEPETMAGGLIAVSAVIVGLAGIWWIALDETLLFSFPQVFRWIEWHPPAVFFSSLPIPVCAATYAKVVL